ncbi:DUF6193 family natural product biosynthesis protein [Kitasatospora sp. NPDC085464]|uniref:DUF6193 family natural product biosynthesis protein n=1 Tax=Kitasatospora sp. NPDC085464 TaxID=3364063 RepID=UPI0037CB9011
MTEGVPFTDPLGNGTYRVRRPYSLDVLGTPDGPEAAVALVVAHLPPDLGPVFDRPQGVPTRGVREPPAGGGRGGTARGPGLARRRRP